MNNNSKNNSNKDDPKTGNIAPVVSDSEPIKKSSSSQNVFGEKYINQYNKNAQSYNTKPMVAKTNIPSNMKKKAVPSITKNQSYENIDKKKLDLTGQSKKKLAVNKTTNDVLKKPNIPVTRNNMTTAKSLNNPQPSSNKIGTTDKNLKVKTPKIAQSPLGTPTTTYSKKAHMENTYIPKHYDKKALEIERPATTSRNYMNDNYKSPYTRPKTATNASRSYEISYKTDKSLQKISAKKLDEKSYDQKLDKIDENILQENSDSKKDYAGYNNKESPQQMKNLQDNNSKSKKNLTDRSSISKERSSRNLLKSPRSLSKKNLVYKSPKQTTEQPANNKWNRRKTNNPPDVLSKKNASVEKIQKKPDITDKYQPKKAPTYNNKQATDPKSNPKTLQKTTSLNAFNSSPNTPVLGVPRHDTKQNLKSKEDLASKKKPPLPKFGKPGTVPDKKFFKVEDKYNRPKTGGGDAWKKPTDMNNQVNNSKKTVFSPIGKQFVNSPDEMINLDSGNKEENYIDEGKYLSAFGNDFVDSDSNNVISLQSNFYGNLNPVFDDFNNKKFDGIEKVDISPTRDVVDKNKASGNFFVDPNSSQRLDLLASTNPQNSMFKATFTDNKFNSQLICLESNIRTSPNKLDQKEYLKKGSVPIIEKSPEDEISLSKFDFPNPSEVNENNSLYNNNSIKNVADGQKSIGLDSNLTLDINSQTFVKNNSAQYDNFVDQDFSESQIESIANKESIPIKVMTNDNLMERFDNNNTLDHNGNAKFETNFFDSIPPPLDKESIPIITVKNDVMGKDITSITNKINNMEGGNNQDTLIINVNNEDSVSAKKYFQKISVDKKLEIDEDTQKALLCNYGIDPNCKDFDTEWLNQIAITYFSNQKKKIDNDIGATFVNSYIDPIQMDLYNQTKKDKVSNNFMTGTSQMVNLESNIGAITKNNNVVLHNTDYTPNYNFGTVDSQMVNLESNIGAITKNNNEIQNNRDYTLNYNFGTVDSQMVNLESNIGGMTKENNVVQNDKEQTSRFDFPKADSNTVNLESNIRPITKNNDVLQNDREQMPNYNFGTVNSQMVNLESNIHGFNPENLQPENRASLGGGFVAGSSQMINLQSNIGGYFDKTNKNDTQNQATDINLTNKGKFISVNSQMVNLESQIPQDNFQKNNQFTTNPESDNKFAELNSQMINLESQIPQDHFRKNNQFTTNPERDNKFAELNSQMINLESQMPLNSLKKENTNSPGNFKFTAINSQMVNLESQTPGHANYGNNLPATNENFGRNSLGTGNFMTGTSQMVNFESHIPGVMSKPSNLTVNNYIQNDRNYQGAGDFVSGTSQMVNLESHIQGVMNKPNNVTINNYIQNDRNSQGAGDFMSGTSQMVNLESQLHQDVIKKNNFKSNNCSDDRNTLGGGFMTGNSQMVNLESNIGGTMMKNNNLAPSDRNSVGIDGMFMTGNSQMINLESNIGGTMMKNNNLAPSDRNSVGIDGMFMTGNSQMINLESNVGGTIILNDKKYNLDPPNDRNSMSGGMFMTGNSQMINLDSHMSGNITHEKESIPIHSIKTDGNTFKKPISNKDKQHLEHFASKTSQMINFESQYHGMNQKNTQVNPGTGDMSSNLLFNSMTYNHSNEQNFSDKQQFNTPISDDLGENYSKIMANNYFNNNFEGKQSKTMTKNPINRDPNFLATSGTVNNPQNPVSQFPDNQRNKNLTITSNQINNSNTTDELSLSNLIAQYDQKPSRFNQDMGLTDSEVDFELSDMHNSDFEKSDLNQFSANRNTHIFVGNNLGIISEVEDQYEQTGALDDNNNLKK